MIKKRHTCKLFKNILNDVQTKGNGEIIAVKHNYYKIYFDTLYVEGLKSLSHNYVLPLKNVK